MSCCCSRATLSIIIGVLHSIANIIIAVYCVAQLVQLEGLQLSSRDKLQLKCTLYGTLALGLLTAVFSMIMVVGVVKKRYKLLAPYLWLSAICMVLFVIIYMIIIGLLLWQGVSGAVILVIIIRIIFVIGIQILVMSPIFLLYREWRSEAKAVPPTQQSHLIYGTAPHQYNYQNVYEAEKSPTVL